MPSLGLFGCVLFATLDLTFANGCHDAAGNIIGGLAKVEEDFCTAGALGDETPSIDLWAHKDPKTRGPAPYPYPNDRKYKTAGGPVAGKINVHLVPHTHDDTGWQVTVDQYFERQVFFIIDTVVEQLSKDPNRKFIYVETAFFARWWEQSPDEKRLAATKIVKSRQLEFINGGWCMHDEASPLWTAMVDQTTRGHQWLYKHFGADAAPRGTWQIDPFGHSNTQAWLLSAEAGMESLFWGRMDYQDRSMRYAGLQGTKSFEWIWQGSHSLGASSRIFAGNLYGTGGGGYATWFSFDKTDAQGTKPNQVNDDPSREDWNVDEWVDKVVQNARAQASHTMSDHQLWALGSDFEYQNADRWYRNLDKLIHYVNMNGTVNVFYSTPSLYADQKKAWNGSYEVRADDIFPLADDSHNYWSGYFTSRPALKRQVRLATNMLMAARQLEVLTNTSAAEVPPTTPKHSPPLGDSWTDSFEGTIGVATHHDGMSGTERQDVTDDYAMRISTSQKQVEGGMAVALGKLLHVDADSVRHCHCHVTQECLNISVCAATTGRDAFTVAAWNPLGHAAAQMLRIPVTGNAWAVTGVTSSGSGGTGVVPSQLTPLDTRTLELPLLYLNKYNMSASAVEAAQRKLANQATHELIFRATLPPLGLVTYTVERTTTAGGAQHAEARAVMTSAAATDGVAPSSSSSSSSLAATAAAAAADVAAAAAAAATADVVVQSDTFALTFDGATGLLASLTNKKLGVTIPLEISWGWYNSSVGGCTDYNSTNVPVGRRLPPCSHQRSGAYIFRPNSSTVFYPGPARKPSVEVVRGPLVTEVRQTFSSWASHVLRLYEGSSHVELEWTAGPIPLDTPWLPPVASDTKTGKPLPNHWGKEVIVRYASGLRTNRTWYSDSNGKEMVRRQYNQRGPSYPHAYNISEPVAGNYYPVNAMMALDDGTHELAVLVDTSQAGASLQDGAMEFMVHRRILADDARGVQEPLNETMCGCNDIKAQPGRMGAHGHEGDGGCECAGLTMRGKHLLLFDTVEAVHEKRRSLSEELNFPPVLAFTAPLSPPRPPMSSVGSALPPNVKLVTLTSNYATLHGGQLLLRLSHLYSVGEHPTLSQPAAVDLSAVFAKEGLKILSAVETSLTANQPLEHVERRKADWHAHKGHAANPRAASDLAKIEAAAFETKVPFVYPKVVLRPMEVRTFLASFA